MFIGKIESSQRIEFNQSVDVKSHTRKGKRVGPFKRGSKKSIGTATREVESRPSIRRDAATGAIAGSILKGTGGALTGGILGGALAEKGIWNKIKGTIGGAVVGGAVTGASGAIQGGTAGAAVGAARKITDPNKKKKAKNK